MKTAKRGLCLLLALALVFTLTGCAVTDLFAEGQSEVLHEPSRTTAKPGTPALEESAPAQMETQEAETPSAEDEPISDAPALNEPAPAAETPIAAPEPERTETPESAAPEPSDSDFVRVRDYIPTLFVELRYATENNFTGTVIYAFSEAWLRYGTVKKLASIQEGLLAQGYSLKIWDAYRPASAQFRLWEVCPNSAYVANPYTGYSAHSCGNTVDLTLVASDGTELEMPSGFDEFSALADRNYGDVSESAAQNAGVLETAMTAGGFSGYYAEWWHFTDTVSYPVGDFEP